MKFYLVGGAVRDEQLGIQVYDKDYVVVGATTEKMLNEGFKPVGNDFPVFLHPETKEEYALARKEVKKGKGHKAFEFIFTPDITLEEDLFRRDLTINSIAKDIKTGELFDPYGGLEDIKNKQLKATSEHFKEDPLRVLRLARFSAKFEDFDVDKKTLSMCKEISASGELEELSSERVWGEVKKAFSCSKPSVFFRFLKKCMALKVLFPELHSLIDVSQSLKYHPEGCAWTHTLLVLDKARELSDDHAVLCACLLHDLGKGITPKSELPKHIMHDKKGWPLVKKFCERLKVDNASKELSLVVCANHLLVHKSQELKPKTLLKLIKSLKGFRDIQFFNKVLLCCMADGFGKLRSDYKPKSYMEAALEAVLKTNLSTVKTNYSGKELGEKIQEKQIKTLSNFKRAVFESK